MILVVTEQLTLRFLLQHQGRFIQSVRSATDALRVLRTEPANLQGVVLDERLPNSRLVSSFVRTHVPGVMLVSWQVAQRRSPFSAVEPEEEVILIRPTDDHSRYVWDRSVRTG